MIRKVAIAQAHREAFPSMFAGLYDQAELDSDNELPTDAITVEGSGTWLDDVDTTTGEIREPQESPEWRPARDVDDPPDEAPDDAPIFSEKPALPEQCATITVFWEIIKPYGWDMDRVNEALGDQGPVPTFMQRNAPPKKAAQALYQWWREKAGV